MNIAHIFCFNYHNLADFASALGQHSQHTHIVVCLAQEPDFMALPTKIQGWHGWHAFIAATQWADLVHFHWKKYAVEHVSIAAENNTPYLNTLYGETDIGDPNMLTICANKTIDDYNGNPSNAVVIPHGIHQQHTTNQTSRNRSNFVVSCLTAPRQTALYFWAPMYRLLNAYPQVELWLGETESQATPSHPQVRMLGQLSDIAERLSASDVLVCPIYTREHGSRLTLDGADMSIKHALAAGCPVVATDSALAREYIKHDETGHLIPFGDGDSLYVALEKLITDHDRLASMSAAAAASNTPGIQQTIAQYDEVYTLHDATKNTVAHTRLAAQVSQFLTRTRVNKASESEEVVRAMSDICRQTDTNASMLLDVGNRVSAIAPPPPMQPSVDPEPQFESLKSFGYEIGEPEYYISKRLLIENKRALGNIVLDEIAGFTHALIHSQG